jgi:hypothetical protein
MNLTSLMPNGAAEIARPVGDFLTSLLKTITDGSRLFTNDSPDGLGMLISALAGVAAALAVATLLAMYFRSGYRTARDIIRHGLAAAVVLGLLAIVVYDMRGAAQAYLGLNPSKPEVEFEIRRPRTTATAVADNQIDKNQGVSSTPRSPA